MADDKNDYYDEVDDKEHERSATNVSEPDRTNHDLWQSTNISTDNAGPTVDQVAPVFAQARADALAHPVTADDDDETVADEQSDAAQSAQEKADRIRESAGYVSPTGADAGQYDSEDLKDKVPGENFSPEPESGEDERTVEDAKAEEAQAPQNVDTTDVDQQHNSEANPPESTPEAPTSNDGSQTEDTTQADLVSDTAGEQNGLDATSAPDATPKAK